MHTLLIYDPGHFHAALTLREPNEKISNDIFVYAEAGKALDSFSKMVESFNQREINPTSWNLIINTEGDPLQNLISEKKGDIAIVAGKNNQKMELINKLVANGINVLADKPWVINKESLEYLKNIEQNDAIYMDIMSQRNEVYRKLQKKLSENDKLFGGFIENENEYGISEVAVHHFYKTVNGAPLKRPDWYFKTEIQGEGIVDLTTHLVDLSFWMINGNEPVVYSDVQLGEAERWLTKVPLEKYSLITDQTKFSTELSPYIQDNILDIYSNGRFDYCYKGIKTLVEVNWLLEEPENGSDAHVSVLKGKKSEIVYKVDPSTSYKSSLTITPHINDDDFKKSLAEFAEGYDQLEYDKNSNVYTLTLSDSVQTSHEGHFSLELKRFISFVDNSDLPEAVKTNLLTKYNLISDAREKSIVELEINVDEELDKLGELQDPLVMVADDDDSYYDLVEIILNNVGIPLVSKNTVNGQDLLNYLMLKGDYKDRESCPLPELILLDLHMPIKDGYEVLKEIKKEAAFNAIPIVMLTKETDANAKGKAIGLGAEDCIVKPGSTKELKKVLKILMDHWLESMVSKKNK